MKNKKDLGGAPREFTEDPEALAESSLRMNMEKFSKCLTL